MPGDANMAIEVEKGANLTTDEAVPRTKVERLDEAGKMARRYVTDMEMVTQAAEYIVREQAKVARLQESLARQQDELRKLLPLQQARKVIIVRVSSLSAKFKAVIIEAKEGMGGEKFIMVSVEDTEGVVA